MKLKDIEITRYSSFAAQTVSQDQEILWREFTDVLNTAVKELSKDGKTDGFENILEASTTRKSAKRGYFVRILLSGTPKNSYVKFEDFERKLEAGVFLDVYLLNESVYKEIEPDTNAGKLIEIDRQIKAELPEHTQYKSKLPRDCFCYFIESEQPETDKNEIFTELLKPVFEKEGEVDLDHSYFAVNLQDEKAVAVIVPKDVGNTSRHKSATKLFNEIIQEYFLSYAKVANETASIEKLKAKEARKNLNYFLDWLKNNPPKTLSQIEYANHHLSTYRADLAFKINRIEIHIHTIEINIANAVKVLNYEILKNKKDELDKILVEPLQHELDQIKTDLSYLKSYDEKAKIQAEEIANQSNLQAGVYGRKLAWFFGLLTLIGAFQLFKGFTDWNDTTAKILILGAIIIIPCWILFANDLSDIFGSNYKFEPPTKDNQQSIVATETVAKAETKSVVSGKANAELPKSSQSQNINNKKRAQKQS